MALSDCARGSDAQSERSYRLLAVPMAESGPRGSRPIKTFLPFSHAASSGGPDRKWPPASPLANLRSVSKVKVVSVLMGLTLVFVVAASYVLAWDSKGLLFTPQPPDHFRPAFAPGSTAATATAAAAAAAYAPSRGFMDMKQLVKLMSSKLQYAPRRVPSRREVTETDSRLFSVIPRHFLPSVKSPCWYEEFSGEPAADPYRKNLFTLRSSSFKSVCEKLRADFGRHLRRRVDGGLLRLRCLPFFYIIGQPKCGTTDLFHRLLLHPEVMFNTMKEPHWWTRKRFGYIRFKDGFKESFPVEDYLDLFDLAAHRIDEVINGNSTGKHRALQFITGEASASTMWDNQAWSYVHKEEEEEEEEEEAEPPFLAQDFIHATQPGARIIVMLRDPVERLYSDYLYFKMANKSAEDFHQKVVDSVRLFQSCLSEKSLRSCAYNTSLSNAMPVRLNLGMYIIFLLDWMTVFQREQILVLRLEDYAANLRVTINKVFDFLSVGPLSAQAEAALTKRPMLNTRRAADRNLGPMLPATRDLLREFHQPLNHKLASVLDNKAFLWDNT